MRFRKVMVILVLPASYEKITPKTKIMTIPERFKKILNVYLKTLINNNGTNVLMLPILQSVDVTNLVSESVEPNLFDSSSTITLHQYKVL
jgi:hypothetical protein